MMGFRIRHYVLLLSMLLICTSTVYAAGPRVIYVEPASSINNSDQSLMGRYLYMGIIFADPNPRGFSGPSLKLGWGKTGKKLNLSYITGTRGMSLEAGVIYLKQDNDATLFLNNEHKGYALEASIRLSAFSVIGVFGKEITSFEFGVGF